MSCIAYDRQSIKTQECNVRQTGKWVGLMVAMVAGLSACSEPEQPALATAPLTLAPAPVAEETAATGPAVAADTATAGARRACMIAGTITVLGESIRSRDCMQIAGTSTEQDLARACEGLADGLKQAGSAPAEVTYMEACPSPSQGVCRNIFGGRFDGHYYERTADSLEGLPQSCSMGGGTWVAG
jgi:hypothetical protein